MAMVKVGVANKITLLSQITDAWTSSTYETQRNIKGVDFWRWVRYNVVNMIRRDKMERINSINDTDYLTLTQLFNNDIMLNVYDDKSFEGSSATLTKEQAKDLVNKLQLLIYGGSEND
jgi:hypothetical protein